MERKQHDLIVIGGGPGGYIAAIRAAQLGFDTACVEMEEDLGGTCTRIGCIPSKALLESSERYAWSRHEAAVHGVKLAGVGLDLTAMMARKDSIVSELSGGVAALFKKNKVTRYLGQGEFREPGVVKVTGQAEIELQAKHVIIATGSVPAILPGVELDGRIIGDSTTGLSFDAVPEQLIVIGAGYIGLELGSVWLRLGSQVTVLEYLDRILPGLDSEIVREAQRVFKKQGFDFRLNSRVTGAKVRDGRAVVTLDGQEPLEADRVLCVTGRKPYTAGLGLERLGIELDKYGHIPVAEHFRTLVDGVYAIGDVITGPMLAHKAEEEGVACVEQIATGHSHVNYLAIPSVVYTEPEIACVGRSEDELKDAGVEYSKGVFMFRANGRAKALGCTEGRVKVLADKATDKLLGIHIFGPRAGELIAECALALEFGACAEDIARTCHAHPTLPEAVREAALGVAGRMLNS
jgi:dihydrolipoamide dehydrogenase